MKFVLKKESLPMIRSFIQPITYNPFLGVACGENGVTFSFDDVSVQGKLTIPSIPDENGMFIIDVGILGRLVAEDQDLEVNVHDGGLSVNLGGTEINMSLTSSEEFPFVEEPLWDKDQSLEMGVLVKLVNDLAIQKTPKSCMLSMMTFGPHSGYGATNHLVMADVPSLSGMSTSSISSDFYRYMNALSKERSPFIRVCEKDGVVGLKTDYTVFWTNSVGGNLLDDMKSILDQSGRADFQIVDSGLSGKISKILDRLFIPVMDFEDPIVQLKLSNNKIEFMVLDKTNRVSRDELDIPVSILGEGPISIRVGFVDLKSLFSKKRIYPMTVSIKKRAAVFSSGDLKEFVLLYV